MSLDRFPGAPPGSYVSEEGWLIIRDEAWTEDEWATDYGTDWRRRHRPRPQPDEVSLHRQGQRYATEEERRAARRQSWRDTKRRKREREREAAA